MDLISNLSLGFATALSLQNILYAFIGCLLGTLIGVLPGIGPVATIAMLLPVTYGLDPTTALIMLAGIFLRRPVRRLDDGDPRQSARRVLVGGDRDRRLSDGAPGTRRHGLVHGRFRLVLRRLRGYHGAGRRSRRSSRNSRSTSGRPTTFR